MIPAETLSQYRYVRDVLEQPEALRRTLDSFVELDLPQNLTADRYRQVVLTGMGSSLHALQVLQLKLGGSGIPCVRIETSELLHYLPKLVAPGNLLVAVSQSGESVEIQRLLDMADGAVEVVGVTNTEGSSLAQRAKFAVVTRAGEEATVSCKTYVAALAGLEWLGGALLGERPPSLYAAEGAMRSYLSTWQSHVNSLSPFLSGVSHVFLVGRGRSLASSSTGGLILKEAAHCPAEGMSSAAFRHGPLEMVHSGVLVCVFEGDSRTAALNQGLAADVARCGGKVAWIGKGADQEAFRIDVRSEEVRPLLEILPVQMLSIALAARAGREPGAFVRLKKVTDVE